MLLVDKEMVYVRSEETQIRRTYYDVDNQT